jgi:hypothetical protein
VAEAAKFTLNNAAMPVTANDPATPVREYKEGVKNVLFRGRRETTSLLLRLKT